MGGLEGPGLVNSWFSVKIKAQFKDLKEVLLLDFDLDCTCRASPLHSTSSFSWWWFNIISGDEQLELSQGSPMMRKCAVAFWDWVPLLDGRGSPVLQSQKYVL
ncbi:hypothetical protein N7539_003280 [Penicillium diatomitis]|uniref:Uncharacterized protein n=1 Tax=Penicillium diatomitis TaxID=2819901 RepID=A0A9X0BZW1_9EURO|nr:uncharacterized protein N7539_003280 [Penicillium diatomitis]KAJ5491713.1 hypothetical protein N7539_003280 [Penicillium diatomitis]